MQDIHKIIAARVLAAATFWIAIGVFFFQHQGLSIEQSLQLVSLYYIAVVVFEFPTGVVGDHFSHKTAVVLGQFIAGASLIALAFSHAFWLWALFLILGALGITLISGSDTAILHALSKDFKKDQTRSKGYCILMLFSATTLGSLLALIDIRLPLIMSGACYIAAGLLVLSITARSPKNEESNIFKTALTSLTYLRQPIIRHLLTLGSLSMGFILAIKWFFNPLLEQMDIGVAYWGIIMGLGLLVPFIGVKMYQLKKSTHILVAFVFFALAIIPIGIVQVAAISIAALYGVMILHGYLEVALDIELNRHITGPGRAGVLSLSSLLSRLGASVYITTAGWLLSGANFLVLTTATCALLLTLGVFSFLVMRGSPKLDARNH